MTCFLCVYAGSEVKITITSIKNELQFEKPQVNQEKYPVNKLHQVQVVLVFIIN